MSATFHEMNALKQLACAIIHRAIDDAAGAACKAEEQQDAMQFLCNVEGCLTPWCVLAELDVGAVVEFAMRRGYDVPTTISPVIKVAGAGAEALPIRRTSSRRAPTVRAPSEAQVVTPIGACKGCGRPLVNLGGQYLCLNVQCDVVEM